jgi:two-component system, NtrC family, response regulator AtoC
LLTLPTNRQDKAHALRILVVEDEPDLRATVADGLREAGHSVEVAADGAEGLAQITSNVFDVVVTDVNLPKLDGVSLLKRTRSESPSTSVVLVTAFGEVAQAVAALKEGAYDYLTKPFDLDELLLRLGHIAERRALELELEQARATLAGRSPETVMVGQSPPLRRVVDKVVLVASSESPVLISGESGTGKELVARMLHDRSARAGQPFVIVNCGALTETLIEAELFGHERGAFTGAQKKRDGRFKSADGGTIFLDEVAELPLTAQTKLLRVLQEGTFEPLGTNATVKVDVRVVSATHRNLKERVQRGQFREDLFYRINVIEIALPPLRERPGDLVLLVQHYLERFAVRGQPAPRLSPAAWAALAAHRFPGNIRELSHAIQHAVVLAGGAEIEPRHLPADVTAPPEQPAAPGSASEAFVLRPLATAMQALERSYLLEVLKHVEGSRPKAAAALEIGPKQLSDKLRTHGIP